MRARQSKTRERFRRELMRHDVGELASDEHGSWSGVVQAVQELACRRAGVDAGVAGTWAAPSEWRERAHCGVRALAVWAGVERPEQSGPIGTSRQCWVRRAKQQRAQEELR
jgi:hypothetical protein